MSIGAAGIIRPNNSSSLNWQPVAYKVRPGDTVSGIIRSFYGVELSDPRYKRLENQIVTLNSDIDNANWIRSGSYILLFPESFGRLAGQCTMHDVVMEKLDEIKNTRNHSFSPMMSRYENLIPVDSEQRELMWGLSWLHENHDLLSLSAGAGLAAIGNVTVESNNKFLKDIQSVYTQYKNGSLTKGQYDYRKAKLVSEYGRLIGPLDKILLNGKTPKEALRIARTKAFPATKNIDDSLQRLNKISSFASKGGSLLMVAGATKACYDVAASSSTQVKDEIIVETAASTLFGVGSSIAIGIVLASNPIGWTAAIVLGTASAIASYRAGKTARALYTASGAKLDLAKSTGIDSACSTLFNN